MTPRALVLTWIKALRSGEYRQTTGGLYKQVSHPLLPAQYQSAFCCLGVLECVRAGHPVGGGYLGYETRDLLGINSSAFINEIDMSLVYLNDELRFTFPQIADVVEHFLLPRYPETAE